MASRQQEIRSFTGLRGLAAVYVMLFHFKIEQFLPGFAAPVVRHGYLSVDLFFVLSGFVMALTYQSLFTGGFDRKNYSVFLKRRIARIYPLYLFVLLVTAFILISFPNLLSPRQDVTFSGTLLNLLMVQAWGFEQSYVTVAWSISAEWGAYILFPFLLSFTVFRSKKISACCAVFVAVLLILLATVPENIGHMARLKGPLDMSDGRNYAPLARCLLEFSLGLLSFRLYADSEAGFWLRKNNMSALLASVVSFLLFIPEADVFIVLLFPLLLVALADDRSAVARFLGWAPVHWLGVISYSLYLTHFHSYIIKQPVKTYLLDHHWPLPNLLPVVIQIGCCFILAALTYYGVEKPGRRLLRRWFEPRRKIPDDGNPNLAAP